MKYSRSRSYNANITNPIESPRTVRVYRRFVYDRCVSTKEQSTISNLHTKIKISDCGTSDGVSFVRYYCLITARCSELLYRNKDILVSYFNMDIFFFVRSSWTSALFRCRSVADQRFMKEVIIFKRSLACVKEKGLYGVYYKGSLADIQPTHSYIQYKYRTRSEQRRVGQEGYSRY